MDLWSWFVHTAVHSCLVFTFMFNCSKPSRIRREMGAERKSPSQWEIGFSIKTGLLFCHLSCSLFLPSLSLSLSGLGAAAWPLWVLVSSQAQRAHQTVRLLPVFSRHRWRTHCRLSSTALLPADPGSLQSEMINHNALPSSTSVTARQWNGDGKTNRN